MCIRFVKDHRVLPSSKVHHTASYLWQLIQHYWHLGSLYQVYFVTCLELNGYFITGLAWLIHLVRISLSQAPVFSLSLCVCVCVCPSLSLSLSVCVCVSEGFLFVQGFFPMVMTFPSQVRKYLTEMCWWCLWLCAVKNKSIWPKYEDCVWRFLALNSSAGLNCTSVELLRIIFARR